jgi:hypothetical protein
VVAASGALAPWQIEWNDPVRSTTTCTARAILTFQDGCGDSWSVQLLREGDAWRVVDYESM